MDKTVIAVYDDFSSANNAVRELVNEGFGSENISMVARDEGGAYADNLEVYRERRAAEGDATAEGAGVGAGVGAAIGAIAGLLVGLGALTIPGIGGVIVAGPLATALAGLVGAGAGAIAGGVTGGLLGALVDMGVPEETAGAYAESVRRGGNLVAVTTDQNTVQAAVDILNDYHPIDLEQRVEEWQAEGWTGYQAGQPDVRMEERSERREETLTSAGTNFADYQLRFHEHFDRTITDAGYSYTQYEPAYRYGYRLALSDRYRDRDWAEVEPEARRYWDEQNPGTWDRYKDAVEYAWYEVKQRV